MTCDSRVRMSCRGCGGRRGALQYLLAHWLLNAFDLQVNMPVYSACNRIWQAAPRKSQRDQWAETDRGETMSAFKMVQQMKSTGQPISPLQSAQRDSRFGQGREQAGHLSVRFSSRQINEALMLLLLLLLDGWAVSMWDLDFSWSNKTKNFGINESAPKGVVHEISWFCSLIVHIASRCLWRFCSTLRINWLTDWLEVDD